MKVTASKLHVRSGPGTNFRVLGSLARGDVVKVVETHDGWVWVEPNNYSLRGWVSKDYLASDVVLPFQPPRVGSLRSSDPRFVKAITAVFGEPCDPFCSSGRVTLPAPLKIGWQDAETQRIACHVKMASIFTAVFNKIHAAGLWHLLKTFDGVYNCRTIKGSKVVSTHSWGISVDLNAETNRQGTPGDMDPRIVAIFEDHGFYHGGRFGGKAIDPMHFEFLDRT